MIQKSVANKHFLRLILTSVFLLVFFSVLISFFLPLIKAISPVFMNGKNLSPGESFSRVARVTGFTLIQALFSVIISVLVGFPAAYLLSHKKFFGRKLLYSMGSVPLCVPSLIVVLGYISTFGMNGILNRLLISTFKLNEAPIKFLYSFWGIVFVQGFYNFPLVMTTVADSWRSVDSCQRDSAKILGASRRKIFFTITLPQIFPSIVSACIPIFIYCFFSFMIVLLFGTPGTSTLELEIYHAGRSSLDFNLVGRLSLVETLVAVGVIFAWSFAEQNLRRNHQVNYCGIEKTKIVGIKKVFTSIYFLILFVCFFLPLISICIGSFASKSGGINHFSLDGWKRIFKMKDFFPSIKNTLLIAVSMSFVCTISGFIFSAAVVLFNNRRLSAILNSVSLLPMAVSSVTIGIGMSSIFKNAGPLVLIAAQSALAWPFAFRQIYSHMTKIPRNVIDSASILSKNRLDVIFKIMIPYSCRGMLSAAGFCFAISAGDATLPLVLSMQKFTTLSLFTYRLAGSYRFTEACVSGILLGVICSVVFGFSKKIGEKNELS